MKKIIILIFLVMVSLTLWIINNTNKFVTINGKTFSVYVADTDEKKAKGLAIFKTLPENKGMIFPFSYPDYYGFWMKDMKFPIDIIYIENYKIVDIFEEVPNPKNADEKLPVYKPAEKASYVLEINSGISKKYDFKKGDAVKIHI